jgi:hypothetical protein
MQLTMVSALNAVLPLRWIGFKIAPPESDARIAFDFLLHHPRRYIGPYVSSFLFRGLLTVFKTVLIDALFICTSMTVISDINPNTSTPTQVPESSNLVLGNLSSSF